MMSLIVDAALDRSRTVLAALVLILITGTIAYVTIPKEANPDINIPIIYVSMSLSGISPEDAERLLVRPMEQELRGIEGVKEMTSAGFEGGANVTLEFEAGFNADVALQDVREAVDIAKSELPDDADEPSVNEVNFSLFPVVTVVLAGDLPERALLRLARHLQDAIEGLPPVLEANIGGDREEQVEIIIDPARVESYGLSVDDISAFVSRSNRLVAAGALDTGGGRFSVKVPGLLEDLEDIMSLPLKVEGDAAVTVADIAEVRRAFKDSTEFARVDGQPALTVEVVKRTGENVIDTIAAVRAVVEQVRAGWPAGVSVSFTQDQSDDINTMLNDLQNSVITAIVLVMVVVVAALGLRSGLLVGVAIPGSFLAGILVISAMGLTINVVVLFGLILAVGMLVDGAIVITEYADRKMAEGKDRHEAYGLAAKRMAWPVIASTATTLAAFSPLLAWTGVVGEFMKFLPITLLAVLSASLVMALIFVPTLGSLVGKAGAADPETMRALAASEHGHVTELPGITGTYCRVLDRALDHPLKVILVAVAALVGVQMAYGTYGAGVEFFPDVEPNLAVVNVHARGNLSATEKDRLVREVERRILPLDDFKTVYTRSGYTPRDAAEDVIGVVYLEFKDWQVRRRASVVMEDIRQRTADLAGINIEVRKQEEGPPTGKPVQVELSATDHDLLAPAVAHVRRGLETIGGYIDIEDSRPLPGIEWQMEVDRAQAAKFNVDVTGIGNIVELVTDGLVFSDYRPDDSDDEIDILARYPAAHRTIDQLDRLRVVTPDGAVPVSSFVTLEPQAKVSTISRVDGHRVMTVKADVPEGVLANDKVVALQTWLQDNPPPAGVRYRFRGEDEEQQKSEEFLGKAFAVALFIMGTILVTQFNSFYSAFLILSAVIMSTIGVMLGLLIAGQPFGIIMSGVGVIALAGIVVNNNIVLIDTYDRLHRTDYPDPKDAALHTGAQRLRPVMLTSITTVLGLLPMVYKVNIDFVNRTVTVGAPSMDWWAQLALAVVSGLVFATVLTLLVTPCALMAKANYSRFIARKFGTTPQTAARPVAAE